MQLRRFLFKLPDNPGKVHVRKERAAALLPHIMFMPQGCWLGPACLKTGSQKESELWVNQGSHTNPPVEPGSEQHIENFACLSASLPFLSILMLGWAEAIRNQSREGNHKL